MALQRVFNQHGNTWSLMNTADVTLIPKKQDVRTVVDYMLISLMYSEGVARIMR